MKNIKESEDMNILRHTIISILLVIAVVLMLFFSSCSDMIQDQLGTSESSDSDYIRNLAAGVSSESVTLTWEESGGIAGIEISWSPDGSTVQSIAAGICAFTAGSLKNGTAYILP